MSEMRASHDQREHNNVRNSDTVQSVTRISRGRDNKHKRRDEHEQNDPERGEGLANGATTSTSATTITSATLASAATEHDDRERGDPSAATCGSDGSSGSAPTERCYAWRAGGAMASSHSWSRRQTGA